MYSFMNDYRSHTELATGIITGLEFQHLNLTLHPCCATDRIICRNAETCVLAV